jgi:hypothetical protein
MTNDDITRRIAINNINNIIKVKYIKDMLFDLIKKREQYFIKMGIVHKLNSELWKVSTSI